MSRSALSERLDLHPNIAGQLVNDMIQAGILREGHRDALGRGRPKVPLEIDPTRRCMLAATISREEVSACRVNLLGQTIGDILSKPNRKRSFPAKEAAELLARLDSDVTLGVGVSVVGFVNPDDPRTLLMSSISAEGCSTDLSPLYDFVGDRPMVLQDDMHALAAKWVLTHAIDPSEQILLVSIHDGSFGAAVLVDGRPSHCGVAGCNELGHVRFPVDTELCHCGRSGCLERICSSEFLHRRGTSVGCNLLDACAKYPHAHKAQLAGMLELLSLGLANAVNFIRPDRLVIESPFVRYPMFAQRLQQDVREQLLGPIGDRLQIDLWPHSIDEPAIASLGWLALAPIYIENWPLHERLSHESDRLKRLNGKMIRR
jgi:predicted NBD/HSP70 family sugar kinase